MWIAGIDGGGTHTRLELRSGGNQFLRREMFGPFNLNSIGEPAFRERLREVFAACGDPEQGKRLCIGAAGVSNPRMGQILAEELAAWGFRGSWKLCGDQEIALRGAMDGPGVAVIAGTGSICFGKNAAGETARSGGYGHLIDDGGSGYALGRDVLSGAVRALDGRSRDRELLEAVYERLGVDTPEALIAFVYSPKTDKSAIAKLCGIALELETPEARAILDRGAGELYDLVRAAQLRLGLEGCPIALLGGLLEEENPYRQAVARRLSALGRVTAPNHDALWGAAQMAWEME